MRPNEHRAREPADDRTAIDAVAARLAAALGPDELAADIPLASLGRWRIGGPADLVATPNSVDALARTLAIVTDAGIPAITVGDGSNLLFDDRGLRGVVRVGGGMPWRRHGYCRRLVPQLVVATRDNPTHAHAHTRPVHDSRNAPTAVARTRAHTHTGTD